MTHHDVIVGNIGTVYEGTNGFQAAVAFNTYVGKSKRLETRAAGESVTWLKDGNIHKEHIGVLGQEEEEVS